LEQLSGGDALRRAELERLVEECERSSPMLDQPAVERFAGLLEGEAQSIPDVLAKRYRITRELGRGGMAVVYLATDVKHGREVAVKVVRSELAAALGTARFLREIEIAAKLHHPHIVSLYDSGEADGVVYYVMPYEAGYSLRQRLQRDGALPVTEAVRILRDVADAMAYAHRHGVLHRDIKPENVMLAERHAVVTDFGIAKAVSEATAGQTLTAVGVALGTPAYMAPEQIAADPRIDHRADIYSFGCLAYEILTGQPPFVRTTVQAVLGAHMTEAPEPIAHRRAALPPPLATLTMRCLEKDATKRWQNADDLVRSLEAISLSDATPVVSRRPVPWQPVAFTGGIIIAGVLAWTIWSARAVDNSTVPPLAGSVQQETTSIAVLPFDNLGPADDEYFAAGMTEEITSRLSAVSGLAVVSRRAAQRFARTDKTPRAIASELGTAYLLTGNVRWTGAGSKRVRITLELLQARDERQLWSTTYDRVIDDIFEVQSDIARQVTQALGVTLLEGDRTRLSVEPTDNHEAYRLYLKGRYYWNKRTAEDARIAQDLFQQAVDLDPSYSRAWVGIGDTWISRGWYSRLAPREAFPKAKSAAMQALAFDSTLSEAHASLAHIHFEFDHDWEAAEREYIRAIQLDPKNPIAHHWYGGFLSAMGRHEEALHEAELARALDPLAPIIQTWVGLKYYFAGKSDPAIAEFLKALELDSDFAPAHWHLGWAYQQAGRMKDGVTEAERAFALDKGSLVYLAALGHAYALAGRPNDARATLDRLTQESRSRHVSAYHVAVIHIALGDTIAGLDWLDRAYDEQSPWIGYLNVDPRVERVRGHPRFERLLLKARLAVPTRR
jgi:serine/threonine-protein kinase